MVGELERVDRPRLAPASETACADRRYIHVLRGGLCAGCGGELRQSSRQRHAASIPWALMSGFGLLMVRVCPACASTIGAVQVWRDRGWIELDDVHGWRPVITLAGAKRFRAAAGTVIVAPGMYRLPDAPRACVEAAGTGFRVTAS